MTNSYDYNGDMVRINVHEAKAKFSHFLKLAQSGEAIIICKRGHPIVEWHPATQRNEKRELGLARKHYPNFQWNFSSLEDPMSDVEIKLWEDGPIFPSGT